MDEASLGAWLWEERGNVLTLLSLLIGALVAWMLHRIPAVRQELEHNDTFRERKAAQLMQPRWVALYRSWLEGALDHLDRWMGRPEDWGKGFAWCLAVGLAYSYGFFFLAWMLGTPARLGDLAILGDPPAMPIAWRLLVALLLVYASFAVFVTAHSGEQIDAWLDARIGAFLPATMSEERHARVVRTVQVVGAGLTMFGLLHLALGMRLWLAGVGVAVIGIAVAGAGIGAVAGMVAAAIVGVSAGSGAGILAAVAVGAGGIAAAGVRTVVVIPVLAVIIIPIIALRESAELGAALGTALFLFILLLPFLNALFDWLSWLASRKLGRKLAALLKPGAGGGWRRVGAFVGHMLVDLAIAIVTLVGLAWSIPREIVLFNMLLRWLGLPTPLAIDDYLCRSTLDPWGQGLWASLMLFSTLVPTAAHLGFLLAAPFVWLLSRDEVWQARARHLMGEGPPPAADLPRRIAPRPASAATATRLAEAGAGFTALNPETLRVTALHFAVVRPCLLVVAFGLACLLLWGVLRLATMRWDPLPRLLLWVVTGDARAVAACFGG